MLISADTFRENATSLIDEIVKPLNEVKVPFSSTHGVRAINSAALIWTVPMSNYCTESR